MIKDNKTLYLEKKDLIRRFKDIKKEELEMYHFRYNINEIFSKNSLVIFIDDDLTYKIMKSRYFNI